jgi:hypothetical protein
MGLSLFSVSSLRDHRNNKKKLRDVCRRLLESWFVTWVGFPAAAVSAMNRQANRAPTISPTWIIRAGHQGAGHQATTGVGHQATR